MPLSVQVYDYVRSGFTPNYSAATALSLLFAVVAGLIIVLQTRLTKGRDFTTIGGKASGTALVHPRGAGVPVVASIVVFGVFALLLPLTQMVLGSFQGYFGVYTSWTTRNYSDVLGDDGAIGAIGTTLALAIAGGAITAVIGFAVAYLMTWRKGTFAAIFVRIGSWVPATAPGIVLGVALLWAYLSTPGVRMLFSTPWLFLLALVVGTLPLAVRALEGPVAQVRAELEEAARVSGATPLRAIIDVTARLSAASLLAAWLLVGMLMSGRLDIPLLLQSTGSQVVATYTYGLYSNGQISRAAAMYTLYMLTVVGVLVVGLLIARVTRVVRVRATIAVPAEEKRMR